MFSQTAKSIFALYALGIGLFIYLLGFVVAPKDGKQSVISQIISPINDAVIARRDDLLTQSIARKTLLTRQFEIQRQAFRQQAGGSAATFSIPAAHTTPVKTGTVTSAPIISEPATTPTQTPIPTPTYLKPRTTVS